MTNAIQGVTIKMLKTDSKISTLFETDHSYTAVKTMEGSAMRIWWLSSAIILIWLQLVLALGCLDRNFKNRTLVKCQIGLDYFFREGGL